MLVRAHIPVVQPRRAPLPPGRPRRRPDTGWDTILLRTLNDAEERYACTDPVPVTQVPEIRDALREAATSLTDSHSDGLSDGDAYKVSMIVTPPDDPENRLAAGGARGSNAWLHKLDSLPDSAKVVVWFRLRTPLERGARARRKDTLPGGALLPGTHGTSLNIRGGPVRASAVSFALLRR